MIPAKFDVRDRGATPRGFRKVYNAAAKESWFAAGTFFHAELRDKRFTQAHATRAGYTPRKRDYTRRKFKKFGHTRPLEFTGETRRRVRQATISSMSKTARVRYPGARVFNFRHPKSQVNMAQEFSHVTQDEADQIAARYDQELDRRLDAANQTNPGA